MCPITSVAEKLIPKTSMASSVPNRALSKLHRYLQSHLICKRNSPEFPIIFIRWRSSAQHMRKQNIFTIPFPFDCIRPAYFSYKLTSDLNVPNSLGITICKSQAIKLIKPCRQMIHVIGAASEISSFRIVPISSIRTMSTKQYGGTVLQRKL